MRQIYIDKKCHNWSLRFDGFKLMFELKVNLLSLQAQRVFLFGLWSESGVLVNFSIDTRISIETPEKYWELKIFQESHRSKVILQGMEKSRAAKYH